MGTVSKGRRGPSWLTWPIRIALAATVAVLLSYLPYRLVEGPSDSKLDVMRAELHKVNKERAKLHAERATRRLQVEALKTDMQTIEDIARQELRMLYPHEKVLRLVREAQ